MELILSDTSGLFSCLAILIAVIVGFGALAGGSRSTTSMNTRTSRNDRQRNVQQSTVPPISATQHAPAHNTQLSQGRTTARQDLAGSELTIKQYKSRITGEPVKSAGVRNERWDIRVNQYGVDEKRVQVFVVDLQSDRDWYASIPLEQVDQFIADKTGLSTHEVRSLYAKG